MALKKDELEAAIDGRGCLGKAADDEPVFILRAHDPQAADLVDSWARGRNNLILAGQKPAEDIHQVMEAKALAVKMREWRAAEIAEEARQRVAAEQPEPTEEPAA